jgi:hypothetical protein
MPNYTPIVTGAAANASVVNTPLGQLDTAIGQLSALTTSTQVSLVAALNEVRNGALAGGIYVTAAQLIAWTEAEAYEPTSMTMNTTYPLIVATATVKWPDGTAGVYTTTTINTVWETVDAYTVTHTASSHTITQAAVSRDPVSGQVITKPALVVS